MLELLAEKVESLCGYKPDLDLTSHFLHEQVGTEKISRKEKKSDRTLSPPTTATNQSPSIESRSRKAEDYTLIFKNQKFPASSSRQLMILLFQLLDKEDNTFLERFASRKHGRVRRYLARDKYDLYPGRPDLAESQSVEIAPGWWLGTNYSRKNVQSIIDLALEVAGPKLRSKIKTRVY